MSKLYTQAASLPLTDKCGQPGKVTAFVCI
jgi:hypothetical protein